MDVKLMMMMTSTSKSRGLDEALVGLVTFADADRM